jgi:hypothetical protein
MTAARAQINSTGRKKILHEHIDLQILESPPGKSAQAALGLQFAGLDLPADAAVVVEAHQRNAAVRFECGTVGSMNIPSPLILDGLDETIDAKFRIKVVDMGSRRGLILASVDNVSVMNEESEDKTKRRSIFPIKWCRLGDMLSHVDLTHSKGPVLQLNQEVKESFLKSIFQNPLVGGLLLPAAFREVLEHIVKDSAEDDENDVPWKSEWLKYCRDELGCDEDPDDILDPEDKRVWIDENVLRFARSHKFIERAKTLSIVNVEQASD